MELGLVAPKFRTSAEDLQELRSGMFIHTLVLCVSYLPLISPIRSGYATL